MTPAPPIGPARNEEEHERACTSTVFNLMSGRTKQHGRQLKRSVAAACFALTRYREGAGLSRQDRRRCKGNGDPLRATSEGESPLAQQRGRSGPERGTYNIKDNTSGPLLSLGFHLVLVRMVRANHHVLHSPGEQTTQEAGNRRCHLSLPPIPL